MQHLIDEARRTMCEDFDVCEAEKEHIPGAPDDVQRYYQQCREEQADKGKEYCARVAWQIYCTHKNPDDPSCTKYGKTKASLPIGDDVDCPECQQEAMASIKSGERNKVNAALSKAGLDGNARFRRIGEGLNVIAEVLGKFGMEQADVFSADMFRGDEGQRTFQIAKSTEDPFSPETIKNSMLVVQWYKHKTGYEMLAYET